jgi:LuxR family maltose regulon positive regulatory protein
VVDVRAGHPGLAAEDEVSYPRERDHLVLARLLIAGGDPSGAMGLLGRVEELAVSHGRTGSVIELRVVQALALDAAGDRDAALALLSRTLALSRREGYVRVFLDEGGRMAQLLRRLATPASDARPRLTRADRAYLNRLLRAFEPPDRQPAANASPARLPEPLTDREFEVLRLVADGRRNAEIAEELWVTVDTVKKHLSHIMDKLAVSNRTEAVAEARELGLLSRTA